MNELKAVLKHLEDKEVKLSSEKVELALADDLVQAYKRAKDIAKEITTIANGLKRATAFFDDKYSELKSKAKELGVPVPKQISDLEKEMNDYKKLADNIK